MIKKKNWEWNEKFNSTEFKLGTDIQKFILEGKVIPNKDKPNEFFGENNFPWSITVDKENHIKSVFFRKDFFDFIEKGLWQLEMKDFVKRVNEILQPEKENSMSKAHLLHVAFRDGFVAIVGIKIGNSG